MRTVARGSKRHTLELLPSIVVPGLASFAGLVLIGHASGATVLGFVSLAWVTSNMGSALVAIGPATTASRATAMSDDVIVPALRGRLLLRLLVVVPLVVAIGAGIAAARGSVGVAIAMGGVWIAPQAVAVFESEVLKARTAFGRSTIFAVARALLGWASAAAAAFVWGGVAAPVASNIAMGVVVALAMAPFAVARRDDRAAVSLATIGRPVSVLQLAGYILSYGDRYVIEAILGPAAVGAYSIAYQLGEGMVEVVSGAVHGALQPRIVREWHDGPGGPARARHTAVVGAVAIFIAGVLAVPVIWIADIAGLVDLLSDGPHVPVIASLVALGVGVNGVVRVASSLLLAEGRLDRAVPRSWLVVAGSVVLVPLLTWTSGTVGAAWATLAIFVALASLYGTAVRR